VEQKEVDQLTVEGYACHSWSNGPAFWYPVHDHPYHKAIVVLEGSITFYLPAKKEEHPLKVGDRLDISAHTAHSATVGPEGVTCLEGQKKVA
jgi:quercetin dioxygenase-like cupin family protein